ncbi:hypothetical protein L596_001924 [Steinernema carpocapsae]|uniref:IBB domain-containing protein n=1 Tax=Steinernema carpocapsae TaxID=34508 RepID=A0A4U8URL1_STECR|nr:hypothetical protein L596_001924 [Steinernema carpocapsae]
MDAPVSSRVLSDSARNVRRRIRRQNLAPEEHDAAKRRRNENDRERREAQRQSHDPATASALSDRLER